MSDDKPFRLLVLADLHHDPTAADDPSAHRRLALGREMLARAVEDARRAGGFDAVAVMGDLLDDGTKPSALAAMAELRAELDALKVPVLVVPGNHDGDPDRLLAAMGAAAGVREIYGYPFVGLRPGGRIEGNQRYPEILRKKAQVADVHGGVQVAVPVKEIPRVVRSLTKISGKDAQVAHVYRSVGVQVAGEFPEDDRIAEVDGVSRQVGAGYDGGVISVRQVNMIGEPKIPSARIVVSAFPRVHRVADVYRSAFPLVRHIVPVVDLKREQPLPDQPIDIIALVELEV